MLTKLSTYPIVAFIIGVLSFFPSISPTVHSVIKNPSCNTHKKAKLEKLTYTLPILYGILHSLSVQ